MTSEDRKARAQARADLITAQRELRLLGWGLTYDDEGEEFRVAPLRGGAAKREACAYYTDNLADAIGTARLESARAAKKMAAS